MKFSRTIVGFLVAAAAFFPAVAPAATAADLQSQMITLFQRVVDKQWQIISMLQAQVDQLKMQINSFLTDTPNATSDLITGQPVTTQFASASLPTQASMPTLIRSPYPGIGDPGSCPRPTDQYGLRYRTMSGAYQSRGKTQGGGEYVTITLNGSLKPPYPVSEMSVPVSGDVFNAAGKVRPGTRVTLFGYVGHSMSGAMPVFSCIELVP